MPTASNRVLFAPTNLLTSFIEPTYAPAHVPMEDTAEAFGHLSVDQNKEVGPLLSPFLSSLKPSMQ